MTFFFSNFVFRSKPSYEYGLGEGLGLGLVLGLSQGCGARKTKLKKMVISIYVLGFRPGVHF